MSRDDYVVHREEYKGYDIEIVQDTNCPSPREEGNLGTIITSSNWIFGDNSLQKGLTPYRWLRQLACDKVNADDPDVITDKHIERILNKYFVILGIDIFDRRDDCSIKISSDLMSQDNDGYIYAEREKVLEEYSVDNLDEIGDIYACSARDMCEKLFKCEISELNNWLQSNCWGFTITQDNELLNSCWGFIGDWDNKDWSALTEARGVIDHYVQIDRLMVNKLRKVRNNFFKLVANKLLTWAKGRWAVRRLR